MAAIIRILRKIGAGLYSILLMYIAGCILIGVLIFIIIQILRDK